MNQIAGLKHQISATVEEQAKVTTDINQSMLNIRDVSESTERGAKEVVKTNDDMGKKLIDLHSNLNHFQV